MASLFKSRYLVHLVAVDARSQRFLIDQPFSILKCVRPARCQKDLTSCSVRSSPQFQEGLNVSWNRRYL